MDRISTLEHLSDEELASKTAEGSRSLFEELVSRYSLRLFYFLRHRTGSDQDIEDLVQETFLKAFKSIDRFDPERKFSTWLYTIASREAISHHRANKKIKHCPVETSSLPGPEETVIQKQESQNIWELATKLPKKEYEALWLYYAEEMPIKDIARVTKKSPITVRVLLYRARLNLAERIDKTAFSKSLAGANPAKHKFSLL
ncbi:MAG: sigma-70 family RNA polymerase sigma factor [Candidatus Aminicenantes bacterium]|nr:MAG: sigma-70 family RNA polymerase sigma factor [Candidatus Aminicenantes bacterium]